MSISKDELVKRKEQIEKEFETLKEQISMGERQNQKYEEQLECQAGAQVNNVICF